MKLNRSYFLIIISSAALIAVLAIQVNWIVQTAKIKEQLFNEKANMVLSRTAEALCADKETCRNMGSCCLMEDTAECKLQLGKDEIHKIDSLLAGFMRFYNFHIDYSFEVIQPGTIQASRGADGSNSNVFKKRLEEVVNKNGVELKLIFPEKKQFILAEMGPLFITSVVLILVVMILFWQTVRSLVRQKRISENTTEFLNNMTHEFKTPLSNIALAGKMIAKSVNITQPEKVKHYSGIILTENEKLRIQVEQVLNMAALERGDIPLSKAELDFHVLIGEVVNCISVQIEDKQGHLKLEPEATHFIINADKHHLANALCNLIDNAIKYSTGKPEITLRTFNDNGNLVVVVADKGMGIEKEYLQHVFDKFFRVPTGDRHDVKGFGLGLAYVKKIIELHGGNLKIESEKGKGTTIIFTLPVNNG